LQYKEITNVSKRIVTFAERFVFLPHLTKAAQGSAEHQNWMEKNWWMVDYRVRADDKTRAERLAIALDEAFKESETHPKIPEYVEELRSMRAKDAQDRTFVERWTHAAYQLALYSGDYGAQEAIMKRLDRYSGLVVEAMCGHATYFVERPGRTVIALDFCEASLERYPVPSRKRILCDLDQASSSSPLHFLGRECVDAVSICFGYRYPTDVEALMSAFYGVLKPGGVLSFIENPGHGFEDMCKRRFGKDIVKSLKRCGFRHASCERLDLARNWREPYRNKFFHVEGWK